MRLPEEVEKELLRDHNKICKILNLDKSTTTEAWQSFLKISDSYVLEGEPLHWLGCTIYIACKSSLTRTVSEPNVVVQSNLVSLSRLLSELGIDLSLADFFTKIRKCVDLLSLPEDFKDHMERLEQNFHVSNILFRKFQPIFSDVFQMENVNPESKANKLITDPPSCWHIMDFTWTLFICVKANVSTDDLVNSYHLLLACIDLVYANVHESGRKEMLKLGISSTPERVNCTEMSHLPCIVDYLCTVHDGIIIDVKSVKEYVLRKCVKKFFENNVLRGNHKLLTEVMEFTTFKSNMKALGKLHEEYTLSTWSVDERVFLGYSSKSSLHSSLIARNPGPTEFTSTIIKNCSKEPILISTVHDLCATLHAKLLPPQSGDNGVEERSALREIKKNISELSGKLFYKFLDSILPGETKKPTFDPNMMLNNEQLIRALFACATEVVLYTSRIRREFPWVLDALSIPPYYCYKVIEVIVTYEDLLTRELVKHLNAVEESILESLAWSSTSPLWKALVDSGQPVPSCENVVQEGVVEYTDVPRPKAGGVDKLAELASSSSILTNSPLADKFMSPIKGKRPHPDSDTNGLPSPKIIAMSKADGSVQRENGRSDFQKSTKESKRSGSTSLFFRKFYYLAAVRLHDMCNQLGLSDIELRRKIWTCFELAVVNHVGLMCNRHLDQLLMCSIFHVIFKIVEPDIINAMNWNQGQWHGQVLIKPDKTLEEINKDLDDPPQASEEHGDITRFYNEVFIHKVKGFTEKFRSSVDNRIVLSPIHIGKSTPNSGPIRVSEKHRLYLRVLLSRSLNSSTRQHYYHFNRSPTKDLHAINNIICKAEYKKPKILKENPPNSIVKKIKEMYADRISLENKEKQK